ncbi:Chemotactic transducer-related protein [hydrothermal vent metagenome]|uniref:Chemotactic transducer-related protein n=1 Tax=hydrothermal vent metagenome TaxID=652676 RepID=A0A3B0ZI65_9ZZZZ
MEKIIIKSGHDEGKSLSVNNEIYLGRFSKGDKKSPSNIYINDKEVSRKHLRFFISDDHVYLQDLNSTNGTSIQGIKVRPGVMYSLKVGDEIRLGSTLLVYQGDDFDEDDFNQDFFTDSNPELEILSEDHEEVGNISAFLDASQVISDLTPDYSKDFTENEDVLRKLSAMAQVSISLGSIKDRNTLLNKIIESIFSIFTKSDRAHILFVNAKTLELQVVKSIDRISGEVGSDKIKISNSIVEEVINNHKSLLIMDALDDERFKEQESVVDLSIRSALCVPLLYEDCVLGLIQITSKDIAGVFTKADLEVLSGIAAQISISLKNSQLFNEIENLFDGFVVASVQVIEARDPTTAGHSFRVAEYTENLAIAVDHIREHKYSDALFDVNQLKEIRYAALLHDFGKVGVREGVLTKEKKLYGHEIDSLKNRFNYAQACYERKQFQGLIDTHISKRLTHDQFLEKKLMIENEVLNESKKLEEFLELIINANEPAVQNSDIPKSISEVTAYSFFGIKDEEVSLINPFEFSKLSLARGSLNPEERIEIESHVSHTYAFLTLIPWSNMLSEIPNIAYAHHEKLDGSGYPRGLTEEQIPIQTKIMTIADIYDALTAGDRPYKKGLSTIKALDILHEEANNNKIDSELLRIFIESKSFKLNLD